MNYEEVRELYQSNGFVWNDEIASFIFTYGNEVLEYCDSFSGMTMQATFFNPSFVRSGRAYGSHVRMADYLGTEIAPVGSCCSGNIDLFLTEAGDLIGFSDYNLLSWSDQPSPNWEDAMSNLLHGKPPRELGNCHSGSPPLKLS